MCLMVYGLEVRMSFAYLKQWECTPSRWFVAYLYSSFDDSLCRVRRKYPRPLPGIVDRYLPVPLVAILATCEHFTRDKSADVTRGRLDVSSTFFLSFCALLLALGERVFGLKNFGFIHVSSYDFSISSRICCTSAANTFTAAGSDPRHSLLRCP